MARMELNAKLSEVNAFLERRAEEQSVNEQERDQITDHIQKDLSGRLQQSRQELTLIRQQMKGKKRYLPKNKCAKFRKLILKNYLNLF